MKTTPIVYSAEDTPECMRSSIAKIPMDYVPPPADLLLTTVPYQWPTDEQWSRSPFWQSSN
jgi:hypothetical protein